MVKIILEGNRREVYAMGFDLMEARNKNGELLFSDIKETEEVPSGKRIRWTVPAL